MFLHVYLKGCKELEHDRCYVQCDFLATVEAAAATVMKKETLVVVVICSRYTAFFEQSIPFWNNMSYSTYIGIQYWKKRIH
jgi:hypothetical protein